MMRLIVLFTAIAPSIAMAQTMGRQVLSIGALDAPVEEVFGRIAEIAVDSVGNIYVLDDLNHVLRVFDRRARFVATVGRRGNGPGEFEEELAASIDRDGIVQVSDGGNLRITSFQLDDNNLRLVGETRTATWPLEICGMSGRRWILHRGTDGFLINEVDGTGRAIARLGAREAPPPALAEVFGDTDHLFYNSMALACDSVGETVVVMHNGQPIVRAFSAGNGEELWRTGFEGFIQQGYARSPGVNGCCYAGIPDPSTGTYSLGWAIVSDGRGTLFATISEYTKATGTHTYEARLLDSLTGEEVGRVPVPGIVMAVREGRAYISVSEPFPRVVVFEMMR